VGRINVYNILAAIGAGIGLEIPVEQIEQGIAKLELVPGRFQRIDEGQRFLVVVDYAHTDDALRNLIATARELAPSGRIITVFGAGGDRDRTKRPLMGEAAGALSDLVVLTSDNPRSEDPLRVINDVVVGLQKANAKYRVEPDREKALAVAIDEAQAGDIVLLAGKGHETAQVLKDRTIEFDDREKARVILRRKGFTKQPVGK
jgi:UDP-N-acetylmuramoyl-L-alanyl-D-glutamate--2,6-diaminopimelate ligase